MIKAANFHRLANLSPSARKALLARTETDLSSFVEKVRPIIAAVQAEGDVALARFAQQFDKAPVAADAIAATPAGFARAEASKAPYVVAEHAVGFHFFVVGIYGFAVLCQPLLALLLL